MANISDPYKDMAAEGNYCEECWKEFVTMSNEELKSWQLYVKTVRKKPVKEKVKQPYIRKTPLKKPQCNPHPKRVYCEDNKQTYKSISDASRATGVPMSTVRWRCNNYKPYQKGFTFRFVE